MKTLRRYALLLLWLIILHAPVSMAVEIARVTGSGIAAELKCVTLQKKLFLDVGETERQLSISVRRDSTAMLVFCTTYDCRPVFIGDDREVLVADSGTYVSADVVAEALGCRAKIKKRDVYLSCPENWTTQKVGTNIGERAPGFRLKMSEDSTVVLNDLLLRGPVVVAFVRSGQWDPLSRTLLQNLESKLDSLRGLGCEVVAIHGYEPKFGARWATELKLRFAQLSDNASAVMRGYEVFDKGNLPFCAVFLLDREGVIRYREVYESNDAVPDVGKLMEKVRGMEDEG